MDFSPRCNSLKCRSQLTERAVVTTCSHIFCVPCSESLGLAHPTNNIRVCPACETQLSNPDDVVVTHLNPTEDYKTSVLSGLSPTIIMECAGRALSFYSYQSAQEIIYQEFLAKSLTDKYSTLSSQMDQVIHDANSEITNLREKMKSMQIEQKNLEQRNDKLLAGLQEKEKINKRVHDLYTKLKQQQLTAGMEVAAENDVENVLDAAHYTTTTKQRNGQLRVGRAESIGSVGSGGRVNPANAWQNRAQGSRVGLQSARSAPLQATPSGVHRTRLGPPNHGAVYTDGDRAHRGTPYRAALNNLDPNVYGNANNAAYTGLSAGVKVGRPQNGPITRNVYGAARPAGVGGLNLR